MENTLSNIADKILTLDEASLTGLWKKYKERMERFDASKEWEKSVLIFFVINDSVYLVRFYEKVIFRCQ
ncbi:MAG: hypothetical protein HQ589_01190 [Syntrophaceae bacterium]|nr:hypothetical protein [Syntrophaceae bacterium]